MYFSGEVSHNYYRLQTFIADTDNYFLNSGDSEFYKHNVNICTYTKNDIIFQLLLALITVKT